MRHPSTYVRRHAAGWRSWWCLYPGCGATGEQPHARAARAASLDHYDAAHPQPVPEGLVDSIAQPEVESRA